MKSARSILLIVPLLIASQSFAEAPLCRSVFNETSSQRAIFLTHEKEIASARMYFLDNEMQEVMASYYQVDGNKSGRVLFAKLIEAAHRGVKVRLIVDSWNPDDWMDKRVTMDMFKSLQDAGVEVRVYNPVDPSKLVTYLNPKNFERMHDKLLILKGQSVMTTGDHNVQNHEFRIRNTGGLKGLSYRGSEIVIQSKETIEIAEAYYNEVWNLSIAPDTSKITDRESERMTEKMVLMNEAVEKNEISRMSWDERFRDVQAIDFLHDVAGEKVGNYGIAEGIIDTLKVADKSIVIYSPYLYLTPRFEKVIHDAIARGVKVRFILPSWNSVDTPITLQNFVPQVKALRKMGVKILQHKGPDFMHAKIAIVDEKTVFLGSYNFNYRSEFTDHETGFVVHDEGFAQDVLAFDKIIQEQESRPFRIQHENLLGRIKTFLIQSIIRYIPFIRKQV